jgi:hypothetical protein
MSPLGALPAEGYECFPCSTAEASAGVSGRTADAIASGTLSVFGFAAASPELGEKSWESPTRRTEARFVATSGRFAFFTSERLAGVLGVFITADAGMMSTPVFASGESGNRLEEGKSTCRELTESCGRPP